MLKLEQQVTIDSRAAHFIMELKVVSWMPAASMPTRLGWKSTSGHLKRSLPMVITCSTACKTVSKLHDNMPKLCLCIVAGSVRLPSSDCSHQTRLHSDAACKNWTQIHAKHTWPSGSSYDFSRVEEDSEVAISCSKSSAT